MQTQDNASFVETVLPWLVAVAGAVLYLLTLNHWVTLASLPAVAKVAGWDWSSLTVNAPLFFVLTYPVRYLPGAWQPVALNLFSALCAAGALGLLAKSVCLLPQDRTRDQRTRERSEYSLLTIATAWIPPVLAALACGLQLTFWENATAATGESLNVLLFAYVIYCLLLYRLDEQESSLSRLAFVYGLAVTNNWAMIAFFPAFVVALIWLKGRRFFQYRFVLRMIGWGAAGLLLYLVLPLAELVSGTGSVSFWQLLKLQWASQKAVLVVFPRYVLLLCGLTSLLPVLIMSIRWPSFAGDTSKLGGVITTLMFRVVHGLFLVATIWVMFDPPFSPRLLGYGLPFLGFYYLSALAIGYFSGFFLLVFGTDPEKSWSQRPPIFRLISRALAGLVWVALPVVAVGLFHRNLPSIRIHNGPHLYQMARLVTQAIPKQGAYVLSDHFMLTLLAEAAWNREGTRPPHVLLDTSSMNYQSYHRNAARRYPGRWPLDLTGPAMPDPVNQVGLMQLVANLARTNEVYYLHPSFGYYFEYVYPRIRGGVYKLTPYPGETVNVPVPTEPEWQFNQVFWQQLKPALAELPRVRRDNDKDQNVSEAEFVAQFYSRAANYWGVELSRCGRKAEALAAFRLAQEIYPDNVSARINLTFHQSQAGNRSPTAANDEAVRNLLKRYRSLDALLRENGPIDDPQYGALLGETFVRNGLIRQAAQQFQRVLEFEPNNMEAKITVANLYLRGQMPDRALEMVQEEKAKAAQRPMNSTNALEWIRLEAWCHYAQTNLETAVGVLAQGQRQHPQDNTLGETLAQMYLMAGRLTNAYETLNAQLARDSNNVKALLNQGALVIQMGQKALEQKQTNAALNAFKQSVPLLSRVVALQPENPAAYFNRAIGLLQSGQLEAAQRDYEKLLKFIPNYYSAYYGLGDIAFQRKDARQAINNYELFLKYAPPNTIEIQLVKDRLATLKSRGASR
jgi:tetratricopeptide (TPR) repeat protein